MTLQSYDELYDEAQRLDDSVVTKMKNDQDSLPEWTVEYEIPAETNGWTYMGNPDAASTTHHWTDNVVDSQSESTATSDSAASDDVDDPSERVVLHYTPTHPQDKTADVIKVYHTTKPDESTHKGTTIFKKEGEPYDTPLYIRRRLFWEAVEAAIQWMENRSPQN